VAELLLMPLLLPMRLYDEFFLRFAINIVLCFDPLAVGFSFAV